MFLPETAGFAREQDFYDAEKGEICLSFDQDISFRNENHIKFRQGCPADLDAVCSLVTDAIAEMERRGIHQWDALYPTREDFAADIQKKTLYTAMMQGQIAAVYVLSRDCDPAYRLVHWSCPDETACILHRLCVAPGMQNRGVGTAVLRHMESRLRALGFESVRLDVFSENPAAVRLYEKNGYERRGFADWRKGRFWLMEKTWTAPGL